MDQDALLKLFATRLAGELTAGESAQALQLARKLALIPQAGGAAAPPPAAAAPATEAIGIWEPRQRDGQTWYERSGEQSSQWTLWADEPHIVPKGNRKRVVLLGESAARGYFYDPLYTPARVLEQFLTAAGLPEGAEVIDLARTDQSAAGLLALLRSALALQPDAFVVFAGNNWARNLASSFHNDLERQMLALVLREHGVAGFKTALEQDLAAKLQASLRSGLALLSKRVPVVLLIPEFNLGDWRLDEEADAPWLPGDLNRRWLACRDAARAALAAGRLQEAEDLAREMIEIDGGTAASGPALLGDCRRRQGRFDEARALLEKARDAHTWDTTPQTPRTLSVLQAALRKWGSGQERLAVVDLPRVFTEALAGEVPDRRLFLDYCHLTSLGIRVAMAAAAEALLPLLGGPAALGQDLFPRAVAPDPEAEAVAHFAAAVHCAHWGQGYGIVHHHCQTSLAASPAMAPLMSSFLALQIRKTPAWACAALENVLSLGPPSIQRYLSPSFDQNKLFDDILLRALTDVLEAAGIAGERERMDRLRRDELGLSAGQPVDLLDAYYRKSWADRDWLWGPQRFYRAHSPVSRFPLVCRNTDQPVGFELSWRMPAAGSSIPGAVLVNGTAVAELEGAAGGGGWQVLRWSAGPEILQTGVNTVEIRWPAASLPGKEALAAAAADLESGLPCRLLPYFAEVHTFRAQAGPKD